MGKWIEGQTSEDQMLEGQMKEGQMSEGHATDIPYNNSSQSTGLACVNYLFMNRLKYRMHTCSQTRTFRVVNSNEVSELYYYWNKFVL